MQVVSLDSVRIVEPSGAERRAAPRVPCRMDVEVTHGLRVDTTQALNLSTGGMALAARHPAVLGEVFALAFDVDDGGPIRCAGLVRGSFRVGEVPCYGVEFHNLSPDDRKRIAAWVRERIEPDAVDPRRFWTAEGDTGDAVFLAPGEARAPALRWSLRFPRFFEEVGHRLLATDTLFIPGAHGRLHEGDRLYVEIVPPHSHGVLRLLAEVTWVRHGSERVPGGLIVRHGGLTEEDRVIVRALVTHYAEQRAKKAS